MVVDYDKNYSIDELKKLSLWDFYTLCLWDCDAGATRMTNDTKLQATALRLSKDGYKYAIAWNADPYTTYKNIHKIWNKDYCEMIERLPDEVVKKIYEELSNE